jgi:hypothetical protein
LLFLTVRRISRHFPAPSSVRSLLLQHLRKESDGKRICILCPQTGSDKVVFAATTGAHAWEYHLEHKHRPQWAEVEKLKQQKKSAQVSDVVSAAESSEPSQKKQRIHEQPAAASSSSQTVSSGQSSLTNHFTVVVRDKAALQLLASALIQGGVSYRFVETHGFRQFLEAMRWKGPLPSRYALKDSITAQADELRSTLLATLQASPNAISIAIDGWTNVQHHKVTNVILICDAKPYYWKSIVNRMHSNTADWLFEHLSPIIDDLLKKGVKLVGFAADNEVVNKALVRQLRRKWPFLIHAPCGQECARICQFLRCG